VKQAKNAQGGVGERGERLGQARPLGVVAIFVPPPVFDEVQAIFHLPVVADVGLEFTRRHRCRVEAGQEIAALVEQQPTIGRMHVVIDAESDAAMRNIQTLADIVGVNQVDPQPAGLAAGPFFSVT